MGRLLVATWGDPFAWREARYRLTGSNNEVKSVTSLSILIEELSPDKVIVLVPETLLSPSPRSGDEIKRLGGRLLIEDIGSLKGEHSEWYRNLLNHLKRAISSFCREKGLEAEVVLMPNLGEYNGVEWRIEAGVNPDSAYAAFTLLSTLSAVSDLAGCDINISLDVTHGVNFMSLAAYRAVKTACMVLSATLHTNVTFEHYNSTPYPSGTSGTPELEVFKVGEEVVTPVKAAQRLIYSYASADRVNPIRRSRDSGGAKVISDELEKLREVHEDVRPLAAAIHYSMPLAFLQFSSELMSSGKANLLDSLPFISWPPSQGLSLIYLLSEVRVGGEQGRSIAPRRSRLQEPEEASLSLFHRFLWNKALEDLGVRGGPVEAPLSLLRETLKYLRGPLVKVAEHELSHLEELRDEDLRKAFETSKGNWVKVKDGCENQRRILVAHAGLAKRSLELKKEVDREMDGDTIILRYYGPCLDSLRDLLSSELRESIGELIRGKF
ncbi:MAG: CRISPR-associated CARF protein Csx1 [Candidatus Korarchaeum sp.]|nr:CRISPR-associated CARF protein Csx1 [Candidatus Korarchaeum sp.]